MSLNGGSALPLEFACYGRLMHSSCNSYRVKEGIGADQHDMCLVVVLGTVLARHNMASLGVHCLRVLFTSLMNVVSVPHPVIKDTGSASCFPERTVVLRWDGMDTRSKINLRASPSVAG